MSEQELMESKGLKTLVGADLSDADLRRVDLTGANLRGASLRWADLIGADLDGANLTGVYLTGANLFGADLSDADLRRADLRGANLRGVNLRWANLTGADLSGADLHGAIMPDGRKWQDWTDEDRKALRGEEIKLEALRDTPAGLRLRAQSVRDAIGQMPAGFPIMETTNPQYPARAEGWNDALRAVSRYLRDYAKELWEEADAKANEEVGR